MNFDRAITVLLTVAALSIAGALVSREIRADRPTEVSTAKPRLSRVDDWERLGQDGVLIGVEGAKVQLVEFTDLECPFCRKFHSAFENVRRQFGDDVSLRVVHYPLSIHKFAKPAARAAECAREQGRFENFVSSVFGSQDSLGLKSWSQYATESGVPALIEFESCLRDPRSEVFVKRGIEVGDSFGVQYTPTVLINGWIYAIPPTEPELISTVRLILKGESEPEAARISAEGR